MYTLKENVKIVLKKEGVIITKESLANNQNLYNLVMENPMLKARYGHNFVEGNYTPKQPPQKQEQKKQAKSDDIIEVNVKKKAEVLKEAEQLTPPKSEPTLSTSKEAGKGGMTLNISEAGQASLSKDSGQSKRGRRPASSKPVKSVA